MTQVATDDNPFGKGAVEDDNPFGKSAPVDDNPFGKPAPVPGQPRAAVAQSNVDAIQRADAGQPDHPQLQRMTPVANPPDPLAVAGQAERDQEARSSADAAASSQQTADFAKREILAPALRGAERGLVSLGTAANQAKYAALPATGENLDAAQQEQKMLEGFRQDEEARLNQNVAAPQTGFGRGVEGFSEATTKAAPYILGGEAAGVAGAIPQAVGGAVGGTAARVLPPVAARALGGAAGALAGGAEFGAAAALPDAANQGSIKPLAEGAAAPFTQSAELASKLASGRFKDITPDELANAGFVGLGAAMGAAHAAPEAAKAVEATNEAGHRAALGLPPDGDLTGADIRKAFLNTAKTAHPDVGGSDKAFIQAQEAADSLYQKYGGPRGQPSAPTQEPTNVREASEQGTSGTNQVQRQEGQDVQASGGGPLSGPFGKAQGQEEAPLKRAAMAVGGAPSAPAPAAPSAPATPSTPAPSKPGLIRQAVTPLLKAWNEVKSVVSPEHLDASGGRMAGSIRDFEAQRTRDDAKAIDSFKDVSKAFDKIPEPQRLDFYHKMEMGQPQGDPALDAFAARLRDHLDDLRTQVQQLGTGKLKNFIENYLPHLYKDPEGEAGKFMNGVARRPLHGNQGFLKQRTFPTLQEAMAHGLTPLSTNPVDMVMAHTQQVNKFLAGSRVWEEGKAKGDIHFLPLSKRTPDGMAEIDDRAARVFAPPEVKVREAFDYHVREGLQNVMDDLGIQHQRKGDIGQGSKVFGSAKGNEILTKIGGENAIITHELGHALDTKYGLGKELYKPTGPQDTATPAQIKNELMTLADERFKGDKNVQQDYKDYVRQPEEQTANALHALIHAPKAMDRVAPTVKARLTAFLQSKPELKPLLDIEPGLRMGSEEGSLQTAGPQLVGRYVAPAGAAGVLNNHLSPGLRGSALYKAASYAGNALNQAQLSLSLYHAGTTSLNSIISRGAVGMQYAADGALEALQGRAGGLAKIGKGIGNIASSPIAPVTDYMRGAKIMATYLGRDSKYADAVKDLTTGGGAGQQNIIYNNQAGKAFMRAIRQGKYPTAGAKALPAALEALNAPIFQKMVPNLKLAAMSRLAELEISRLPQDATLDDRRAALYRAWKSVDNRYGQIRYDNLFWNRAFKDMLTLGVRSVGWNYGTLNELGGGALDALKTATGRDKLSSRTSYLIAMHLYGAALGATLTYLMTGHGPKELRDYFYPPTGRKTSDGLDERVSLPLYTKDEYAYSQHPVDTIRHKANPVLSMIGDMIQNEDYYGKPIRNQQAPLVKQVQQSAEYLFKSMEPFSVRQGLQARDNGASVPGAIGMALSPGLSLAPKSIERGGEKQASLEKYVQLKDAGNAIGRQMRSLPADQRYKFLSDEIARLGYSPADAAVVRAHLYK